jgi:HEAT repeat protein
VLSDEQIRRERKLLIENVEGGQYRPGSESGPIAFDQEDFDKLVALTPHHSSSIRANALELLGIDRNRCRELDDVFIRALEDQDPGVLAYAAYGVATRCQDPGDLRAKLEPLLELKDLDVRVFGAFALAVHHPEACRPGSRCREVARDIVSRIRHEMNRAKVPSRYLQALTHIPVDHLRSLPPWFLERKRDQNLYVSSSARWTFRELGNHSERFSGWLMDPRNWGRFSDGERDAVEALGALGQGDERVVEFLRARINRFESLYRIEAIRAVGDLGDDAKGAAADLKRLILEPDSSEMRRAAGHALMHVDERALLDTLPDLSAIDPELSEELRSLNLLRKL